MLIFHSEELLVAVCAWFYTDLTKIKVIRASLKSDRDIAGKENIAGKDNIVGKENIAGKEGWFTPALQSFKLINISDFHYST